MDWKRTLVIGAICGVLGGLFFAIRSGAKKPAQRDPFTGDLVLRFGPILIWTAGLMALIGPALMIVLSFVIKFKSKNEIFIPIGLGIFFFVCGAFSWLWIRKNQTRVNGHGLSTVSLFKKPSMLAWKDILKLSFSNSMELKLQAINGQKATISIFHTGAHEIVPLLQAQLSPAVVQTHAAVLERFNKIVTALDNYTFCVFHTGS